MCKISAWKQQFFVVPCVFEFCYLRVLIEIFQFVNLNIPQSSVSENFQGLLLKKVFIFFFRVDIIFFLFLKGRYLSIFLIVLQKNCLEYYFSNSKIKLAMIVSPCMIAVNISGHQPKLNYFKTSKNQKLFFYRVNVSYNYVKIG